MTRSFYKLIVSIALSVLLLGPLSEAQAAPQRAASIDPQVAAHLRGQLAAQQQSVIVLMREQEDVRAIMGTNRRARQRTVVQALRRRADQTQGPLRRLLKLRSSQGRVASFTPLWVLNAVAVTASSDVISEIALLPQVASIVPDSTIAAPTRTAAQTSASAAPAEPNVALVNAPALWSLGYGGQGVVVASFDTGVDGSHPDLAGSWRGGTNSWFDPYGQHPTTPTDLSGHGTWTTGVMIGGASGGTAIGVAPQARWIAAKLFNDSGTATTSAIHRSFQWALDPDGDPTSTDGPDIVNNSWSIGVPGCNLEFEPDLQSLVAAGITPVFAAGNYGPGDATSMSPGNNPSAVSVGAVDNADNYASISSRGPTDCGRSSSVIYPAVTAPGVNIYSSDLYGGYYEATGTSLAAPHVSGGLALLLSAFPNLSVADQQVALAVDPRQRASLGGQRPSVDVAELPQDRQDPVELPGERLGSGTNASLHAPEPAPELARTSGPALVLGPLGALMTRMLSRLGLEARGLPLHLGVGPSPRASRPAADVQGGELRRHVPAVARVANAPRLRQGDPGQRDGRVVEVPPGEPEELPILREDRRFPVP